VKETLGDRVRNGHLVLESLGLTDQELRNLRRIVILACGTAYHSGVVGRYIIEEWARIPVEPDIASEWRYRNPVLSKDTLVIGLKRADVRKTMPPEEVEVVLDELYALPTKMTAFLEGHHPIEQIADRFHDKPFFLYLGRHIGLPVALEGALKLKEISYIPTEAYSAGEMKHGPIALLDSETPVVCVATDQKVVYEKVVSNIQEVRARGAQVIAIATDGNEDVQHHADDVIYIPRTP